MTTTDALELVNGFKNEYGKARKKIKTFSNNPWREMFIFFDLTYWETNFLHHNLYLMHIEKRIFNNIVRILLEILGKTKDHLKVHLDLEHLGIRDEVHPVRAKTCNQLFLAKAYFSMTNYKKKKPWFC